MKLLNKRKENILKNCTKIYTSINEKKKITFYASPMWNTQNACSKAGKKIVRLLKPNSITIERKSEKKYLAACVNPSMNESITEMWMIFI